MNKIVAVNFSCSPKSMQQRGIKLLNKFIPFHKIVNLGDFNIPILDTNMADGNVPDSVIKFDKALIDADAYIFFIAEMMGGYCGTFKNAMDWLVVKSNYDKDLNIPYSISHKPMFSVTFSPSYKNGGRHADEIKRLLKNFPEIDEEFADEIMAMDKNMQIRVIEMIKDRRKNPESYDKLLMEKGDSLDFQGEFDRSVQRSKNADGGLGYLMGM